MGLWRSISWQILWWKILAKFKNLNYETKNIKKFKEEHASELFGVLGYLASVDLFKREQPDKSFFNP